MTATAIRNVYLERGSVIFPPLVWPLKGLRAVRQLTRYVYDAKALEAELLRMFQTTILGESTTRLCVPSFEGVHGEPWLFKTPHHPDYRTDRYERIVKVGLSTAAAPAYFRAFENNGYLMVDGGLWANNPIMNAVADALACFDIRRRQIQVLSLGCGETSYRITPSVAAGGFWQWRRVINAAMRAQSLNALGQAFLLIGKDQVIRLDAPESTDPIALDDYHRACAELPQLACSLTEASGRDISQSFLGSAAQSYTPCPIASENAK